MYITHGSGHHSAARAIEKAIKLARPSQETVCIDGFAYAHPVMDKITHAIYMTVINKFPKIWDLLYDNPKVFSRLNSTRESIYRRDRKKVRKIIESENCSVVVCTQAFPCGMVADYKRHYNANLKLIAVITDFMPHSYWVYDEVDFYIVATQESREFLQNKGISDTKIKFLGIPIDPKFSKDLEKEFIANELKISLDKLNILIMGGGRGLGPIKEFIGKVDSALNNINLLVVAGSNQNLFCQLKKIKFKNKVDIFGFIDYVDKLMTISNVLITKPGGVTTAEALAKRLPMLILNPLPGQEQNNTNFLCKYGVVEKADSVEHAIDILNIFLQDTKKLEGMRDKMSAFSKPQSSIHIAELALSLC